ncbi:MAG: 16S rRNA (adenine(1518)-N(6)/adenine(1519)-N(6))-dimethyltransferase RsmA [Alphaproteobacteria bacterium]|nr:16S rRNA (adenine(1518)-N(6)/adenine(1519)-N(6))-dimethyltransferase RsmA [Alphaproteobacteria bacterium]
MRGWTILAEPDLPSLRDVVARYDISARKSLGQNFLFDLNLTRRIARAAGPLADTTVYEVGPGPGGLTRALLAEGAARVIAVERDRRCLAALSELAAAYRDRLLVIEADALELDEVALLAAEGVTGAVRVAANLPYNIGSALLVKWLSASSWPPFWQSLTLMFQREVAMRLVAAPRTPAYGRLSVLSQWRTQPQILFDVHPSAFTPAPKVTSTVVRIDPLAAPRAPCHLRALEQVTAAGFGNRRKMLRQSLKALYPDAEAQILSAGLEPTARAEELSIADFAALARALDEAPIRR